MRMERKVPRTVADVIDNLLDSDFSENEAKTCRDIVDRVWYLCEERSGGFHSTAQELYGLLNFLNDRIIPAIRCDSHEDASVREWLESHVEENLSENTLDYIIEHKPISKPSVGLDALGTI